MSNPRAWRAKQRTSKPNARQKRDGLFIDAHPVCQSCGRRRSSEAHHDLPRGNRNRYRWEFMKALCVPCHVELHQRSRTILVISLPV